jgi:hypothetical protein
MYLLIIPNIRYRGIGVTGAYEANQIWSGLLE